MPGHPSRLWVGEADDDQEMISLAVLHQNTVVCLECYLSSYLLAHLPFTNLHVCNTRTEPKIVDVTR
jgi:hypothetical protein